ncbi:MAG: hypothetical protein F4Y02_13080, partial [Chloroflexi bacterium]|nr:hypothetical protein [Chloroflexota bacterium]
MRLMSILSDDNRGRRVAGSALRPPGGRLAALFLLVILAVIVASVLFTAPLAGAQNLVQVTVSFAQAEYTVAEGEDQQITVNLSRDPQRTVVIPITVGSYLGSRDGLSDAGSDDYSVPDSVTFNSGQTSQTITFTATDDTENDNDEGVGLEFGSPLPAGVTAGTQSFTDIYIEDNDLPENLTVQFFDNRIQVMEGESAILRITLSVRPERELVIPLTVTHLSGASATDYRVPLSVTFGPDDRDVFVELEAIADGDDDGEFVRLGFGSPLPAGVNLGDTFFHTTTIEIVDGGGVSVGLAQVGLAVTAHLRGDRRLTFRADRAITSNEVWQWQRSATRYGAYSDIPASEGGTANPYTPSAGDLGLWLRATVTYDLTYDSGSPDEVTLTGLTALGTTQQPVLTRPAVSNAGFAHFDDEGRVYGNNRPVTHRYAQGFATGPDPRGYLLVRVRVSLYVRDGNPSGTWAVYADDGGKPASAPLFAALPLPPIDNSVDSFEELVAERGLRLEAGTRYWIVLSQTSPNEDGLIGVSAWARDIGFFYDLGELGQLVVDPDAAYPDPWTGPTYVTNNGEQIRATSPVDAGSAEGLFLNIPALSYSWEGLDFHSEYDPWVVLSGTLANVSQPVVLQMSVEMAPDVTVEFASASQSAAEGGDASVELRLSEDPRRTVTVPITATNQDGATSDDYQVPSSVTFLSGETSKTITLAATQDGDDDDDEWVRLGLGEMPDGWITAGTRTETRVDIADDDHPVLTVEYGQDSQLVAENETVQVTVRLSAAPEREVTIPITATPQGTASAGDFNVPDSVTFAADETEKTVAFTAVDDEDDDDDESVKLGFGTGLPERITAGPRTETTLDIGDNDNPIITVTFAQAAHTVAEGGTQQVTVNVSADPERTIIIPITAVPQGRASADDYTVTPSVTFHSGSATPQTFTFEAVQDLIDDDDDKVTLRFGTMPDPRVSAGTPASESIVTIEDDDTAGFLFNPSPLTVHEDGSAGYTVVLTSEPSDEMTVTIAGSPGSDLSPVEDTLTFTADNWTTPQAATVTAALDQDEQRDDDFLVHTGGGAVEYAGLTRNLPVTVVDMYGRLRLVDGERTDEDGNLCEGRLEIFLNGEWGSICDDYWTPEDADVACRQLGFAGGSVLEMDRFIAGMDRRHTYFPPGTGEFWLDDMKCDGAESSLLECPAVRGYPVRGCRRFEEVGLRCVKRGAPWISDIEISAPPGGNGQYDAGETVEVTLVWSEPVVVRTPPGGQPATLWLNYGGQHGRYTATYARGSGTDRTVFAYTVQDPTSVIYVLSGSMRHRDTTIRSQATGIDAHLKHGDYSTLWPRPSGTGAPPARVVGQPALNDPGEDETFGPGDTVEVTLAFSREVLVDHSGGHPTVTVRLGGVDERTALYREDPGERLELSRQGGGMEQLVFAYTLGHRDGTYGSLELDANVLSLNGSAIRDVEHGLNVSLEHRAASPVSLMQETADPEVDPGPGEDETAPLFQSAGVDGSELTLTYDEELDNSRFLSSALFSISVNGDSRPVVGVGVGQTSVTLLLSPAVVAGDTVTADYAVPADAAAGRIQDASGNAAAPFSGQAVTNNTASSNAGRSVEASAPGVPANLQLALHRSGRLKATWTAPGSGPVPDGYTVQWKTAAGDWEDPDQVSETDVTKTSYVIGGLDDGVEYAVRVLATSNEVDGDPSGEVTATPRETTPPAFASAAVDGAGLTLTFNETLDAGETPDRSAFAVTVDGIARSVDTVTVSGATVTLTLVTAAFAGETVTVAYTAPADGTGARLKDLAGNSAGSFTGQQVANETREADRLTAAVSSVPGSHDADFTFELRFSEEPKENFSYETMRDHAFKVTGGVVTKSRRLAPSSNVGWEVHIRPDGNGKVTIVLPVTTDCTAESAVCTSDRRPLSNRLEVDVPRKNRPATGAPVITGTAQVGQTLTADTSGIGDPDGIDDATFSYQWIATDDEGDTAIASATASAYTLVPA